MDNRTRVVRYADTEEVIELCKEIAALEKRLSQAEHTIKTMQNATQYYGNVTISNDVMQWDINTQRYVPINVRGVW